MNAREFNNRRIRVMGRYLNARRNVPANLDRAERFARLFSPRSEKQPSPVTRNLYLGNPRYV